MTPSTDDFICFRLTRGESLEVDGEDGVKNETIRCFSGLFWDEAREEATRGDDGGVTGTSLELVAAHPHSFNKAMFVSI